MSYIIFLDNKQVLTPTRQRAMEVIDAAISEGVSVLEIVGEDDAEPLSVSDVLDWRELRSVPVCEQAQ